MKTITITLAQLRIAADVRGAGFYDAAIAHGSRDGDKITITLDDWKNLSIFYGPAVKSNPPPEAPEEPSTLELSANFAGAMSRWAAAGFATVSADEYAARAAACDACEHWQPQARAGLGKCAAPGCGCTKFKRWLASERCPLRKWPS